MKQKTMESKKIYFKWKSFSSLGINAPQKPE